MPSGVRRPSEHTIVGERVGLLGLESFDLYGVAIPKLSQEFLLADLSVEGELTDGEDFGPVDGKHPTMLDYYPGIRPGGVLNDQRVSIVYSARDGVVSVDVPSDETLNSIMISSDSAADIFTECAISGTIDPCGDDFFFHGVFGPGTIGSMSFGSIMEPGLAEEFLLNDLSVVGGIVTAAGPVGFRDADLIYISLPEPSSSVLLLIGFAVLATWDGLRLARRHMDRKTPWRLIKKY